MNSIFLNKNVLEEHYRIFGTTAGNSDTLDAKPNEVEKPENTVRLQATKDRFWELSEPEEFNRLHDAIISFIDIDELDQAQLKRVFDMLPAFIFGKGIMWSFNDSEVGDDMYKFIEGNLERVRAAIG